jgi:hypothetical protein
VSTALRIVLQLEGIQMGGRRSAPIPAPVSRRSARAGPLPIVGRLGKRPQRSYLWGMSERALRAEPAVTIECLSCRHVGVLTRAALSRLAITLGTPIAAFVKRLRCSKCGSRIVLATRKAAARPQKAS